MKKNIFLFHFKFLHLLKQTKQIMANKPLCELIDKAREGRTQSWIVRQMIHKGCEINDVRFSRKKYGDIPFTEKEAAVLSQLINIKKEDLLKTK